VARFDKYFFLGPPEVIIQPVVGNLLLDTYTDAVVGYSLRKLRTTYTGSAIRVRRSSDNTEINIGFVNDSLDTATLLSFVGSGNGFVTTWYDQSTNSNRNLTQISVTSQPQIVSNGNILLENGRPTILFDGTNDHLIFTSSIPITTSFSAFGNFTKVTHVNNEGFFSLLPSGTSPNNRDWASADGRSFEMGVTTSQFGFVAHIAHQGSNGFTNGIDIKATITLNNPFIFSAIESANNASLRINNISLLTDTYNGTPTAPNGVIVGARFDTAIQQFGNIRATELILYNVDQTANRTAIENQMNAYYTIF
jgi:hypothetical protein